jgi:hypothetical protein
MLIHRRIADDLTHRGTADPLIVAHHLLGAGSYERAVNYLEQGARRARFLGSRDVARQAYEQALEAFDAVDREAGERGTPRPDPTHREELERALDTLAEPVS